MTGREFCYWLQGYLEIVSSEPGPAPTLTPRQLEVIARHLGMVFKHEIDPSYPELPRSARAKRDARREREARRRRLDAEVLRG